MTDASAPVPSAVPTGEAEWTPGDLLTLVTTWGAEYQVEFVRNLAALKCCMVIRWTGVRPLSALSAVEDQSTICRKHLREVRRV